MKTVPRDVTSTHKTPRFVPGTTFGPAADGTVYMYVKVTGSGAIAGNFAYPSDLTFGRVTVTPTRTASNPVGVFVSAPGSGDYAYIKIRGTAAFASASGTLSAGITVQEGGANNRIATAAGTVPIVGRLLTNADYGTAGTVLLDIEPSIAPTE